MSVLESYQENYDRIAADHVAHWRKTGQNPFQNPRILKANEDNTVALIEKHAPEGRMLDAGCGMGDLLMRFPERQSVGVDISDAYIKVARERGLNAFYAHVEKLPWGEEFELVVATDILEHVLDIHAATKELLRVLKPGGHMIVRVPNLEPVAWHDNAGYRFTHLRIMDEGTVRLLFDHVFECEVKETLIAENCLHLVAQK